MTVLILERVTPSLRGDLSRWMVEVATGVFVGRVSKLIREALWDRCLRRAGDGSSLIIWRESNEQGFDLRSYQPRGRFPVRIEGVWLARIVPGAEQ